MVVIRDCPRCEGAMYHDTDYYGTYKACYQCGYTKDVEETGLTFEKSKYSAAPYISTLIIEGTTSLRGNDGPPGLGLRSC